MLPAPAAHTTPMAMAFPISSTTPSSPAAPGTTVEADAAKLKALEEKARVAEGKVKEAEDAKTHAESALQKAQAVHAESDKGRAAVSTEREKTIVAEQALAQLTREKAEATARAEGQATMQRDVTAANKAERDMAVLNAKHEAYAEERKHQIKTLESQIKTQQTVTEQQQLQQQLQMNQAVLMQMQYRNPMMLTFQMQLQQQQQMQQMQQIQMQQRQQLALGM